MTQVINPPKGAAELWILYRMHAPGSGHLVLDDVILTSSLRRCWQRHSVSQPAFLMELCCPFKAFNGGDSADSAAFWPIQLPAVLN
jgi:hypothetical protein